MDDIFVIFKKKDQVKKRLSYSNSCHGILNSLAKKKKNNKILFLDVSIGRNNNVLETSIFRKPTFSGVYSNFDSFLPTECKRGLPHTLLYRTCNICFSYLQIREEVHHLKSVWQKNSFPLFFRDNCILTFWINYSLNIYQILLLLRRKK